MSSDAGRDSGIKQEAGSTGANEGGGTQKDGTETAPSTAQKNKLSAEFAAILNEQDEPPEEYGLMDPRRQVFGWLTVNYLFHGVLMAGFLITYFFVIYMVPHDPDSEVIDGHPAPTWYLMGLTSAFGTAFVLDIIAFVWTLDSSRAALFTVPLCINFIAVLCYGSTAFGIAPTQLDHSGRRFIPMRWVKWMFTTPMMLYMYSILSSINGVEFLFYLGADIVMLCCGILACISGYPHCYVFFLLSMQFWAAVCYFIKKALEFAIEDCAPNEPEFRNSLAIAKGMMLGGWIVIPSIWVLSDFDLVDPTTEEIMFEIIDFITKAGTSVMLLNSSIQAFHEREYVRRQQKAKNIKANTVAELQRLEFQQTTQFQHALVMQRSNVVNMVNLAEQVLHRTDDEREGAPENDTTDLMDLANLSEFSLDSLVLFEELAGTSSFQSLDFDFQYMVEDVIRIYTSQYPEMIQRLDNGQHPAGLFLMKNDYIAIRQCVSSVLDFLVHRERQSDERYGVSKVKLELSASSLDTLAKFALIHQRRPTEEDSAALKTIFQSFPGSTKGVPLQYAALKGAHASLKAIGGDFTCEVHPSAGLFFEILLPLPEQNFRASPFLRRVKEVR